MSTKIEWTDATWNPVRGCSRVSEGCRNCYAERTAYRFSRPGASGEEVANGDYYPPGPFHTFVDMVNGHPAWTGKVELIESKLQEPLHWNKPKRIFVNSMSDLFHEALPDEAIDRVFAVMALSRQHTFQILTKRPARMLKYLSENDSHEARRRVQDVIQPPGSRGINEDAFRLFDGWPLPNVWLAVSVEDQRTADERIPLLLRTPAAVRFVSYEPALGPVDFSKWIHRYDHAINPHMHPVVSPSSLDWIIVGGESGPGARPFDIAWARNTVALCKSAGVACFVKQLGADPFDSERGASPIPNENRIGLQLRDRKGGDWTEWPADLRVREYPEAA